MELKAGFILEAWAEPINYYGSDGFQEPMIFLEDLPESPPQMESLYCFLDEKGKVTRLPSMFDVELPRWCYVQYAGSIIPPPPPGYRYVKSELDKDPMSVQYYLYHVLGTPGYTASELLVGGFAPYQLPIEEQGGLTSALVENEHGYYAPQQAKLVTNFIIQPKKLVYSYDNVHPVQKSIEYAVMGETKTLLGDGICKLEELDRLPERVCNENPGCLLNPDYSKAATQVAFHLKTKLLGLPRWDRYTASGWTEINGRRIYGQDSVHIPSNTITFDTGFKIARNPHLDNMDAMRSAMGILNICNDPAVIVPMVLYAHIGVLFSVFEEAGFPPRMLMFVNGKTGSLKTAVSSVLYNLTGNPKNNVPCSFRDTIASVEAKFIHYQDKVQLVDDFAPATTPRGKLDRNALLEALIRYFGDGKGRSRSNAKVSSVSTPIPRGLCCITGEDTGGSQSSLLRCLLINVSTDTFDGKLLAPYQSDPSLWTTHFAFFIEYVSDHFEQITRRISSSFPKLRNQYRQIFKAGRIVDSAVHLTIMGEILLEYGMLVGWAQSGECQHHMEVWRRAIIDALGISEKNSTEHDPVKLYLHALFDAVNTGSEKIAVDKDSFIADSKALGFEQNGEWRVWPDRTFNLVDRHCKQQHIMFPLSMSKIHAALGDAGVIKVQQERRGEKINKIYTHKQSFGERARMLILDKTAAIEYLDRDF